jgi:hypothetical protein
MNYGSEIFIKTKKAVFFKDGITFFNTFNGNSNKKLLTRVTRIYIIYRDHLYDSEK